MENKEGLINDAHHAIFGSYRIHLINDSDIKDYEMCVGSKGELIIHTKDDELESEAMFCAKGNDVEVLIEGQLVNASEDENHAGQFSDYFPGQNLSDAVKVFTPTKFIISDGLDSQSEENSLNLINSFAGEVENRMVEHMNDDHVDAIRDYCKHAGVEVGETDPAMIGVDQYGFDVMVEGKPVRFKFDNVCKTPVEVREALVDMAKRAR
ncbi:MAG: DUF2470 domain-containing protein, partial [Pseudomonadota bacterium]